MSRDNFIFKVEPFEGILDGKPYLLVTVRDPQSGRTEGRAFPTGDMNTLTGELKLMRIIREMQNKLKGEKKWKNIY